MCLNKLCSKFEVDITKIKVPMRFFIGIAPKIATGWHPNSTQFQNGWILGV